MSAPTLEDFTPEFDAAHRERAEESFRLVRECGDDSERLVELAEGQLHATLLLVNALEGIDHQLDFIGQRLCAIG